jgi:fructokinase
VTANNESRASASARAPAVVCLGEALIDLIAIDGSGPLEYSPTFHMAPGGAPANVAVTLARLGTSVAFVGKVGDDPFGRVLCETFAREHVDIRNFVSAPDARTALAFVGSDGSSGRRFVFYHAGMADTLLDTGDLDRERIERAHVFHFGSVTLTDEPSRTATLSAARWARASGCLVSFDPNVRMEVWDSPRSAHEQIEAGVCLADVVKVSLEELEFLTGTLDLESAGRTLRERGPSLVVVTLGADGCFYQTAFASGRVAAPPVTAIDTLGAGDAFVGGLLTCIAANDGVLVLEDVDALERSLRFANAVAALTTTRYGAIPALPSRAEVDALLTS